MQGVLKYLRANGYKVCIVTGGGQDFVRVSSEATYGIPPEQVVGPLTNGSIRSFGMLGSSGAAIFFLLLLFGILAPRQQGIPHIQNLGQALTARSALLRL